MQFQEIFKNKKILLGVSGGIASYKAIEIASRLTQFGATVQTIMTENATKFVAPLTFQVITRKPVLTDLFSASDSGEIQHISISENADLFIVAPSTANIIAKAACGIADDALSTTFLAVKCKILVAPAMNSNMWSNPATQKNIQILKERGIFIVEPETGALACSKIGKGRLASVETILENAAKILSQKYDLSGVKILITAGGTREPIDPVRFIGNRSSGKMGYLIAEAALSRGASVTLITGPSCLEPPAGAEVIRIETAQEMHNAILSTLGNIDVLIMAAAVADFKPKNFQQKKIKKEDGLRKIELEKNPDILSSISSNKKKSQVFVGFAAESENIIDNAIRKLKQKKLDLIVANDISSKDAGFESDFNRAILISESNADELKRANYRTIDNNKTKNKDGNKGLKLYNKKDLAEEILDWVSARFLKNSWLT